MKTLRLKLILKLKKGFHIYSSNPDLTLSPSYFEWMDTTLFSAIGIMEEPTPYIAFDEMFSMEVGKHKKDVKVKPKLNYF